MSSMIIKPEIFAVGAIDWDRTLFDELIPLPDGTSYNCYLVKGNEKIALIDTVDPTKTTELLDNLKKINLKPDYIICNHAEQDHSGSIPAVIKHYPNICVITNPRCKDLLMEFHLIPEDKFILVKDGESISLGDKTLKFIYTPWSHWPETMVTYLVENRILFSCDLFGSHLASSELYGEGFEKVFPALRRYYAEIMMPFRKIIKGNIKKIKELEVEIIAPSHGPVHNEPELVVEAYEKWVSDDTQNLVVIPYVSMHGSTEKMVEHLIDALIEKGVKVKPFNLSTVDVGKFSEALVDATTIIFASPTVLTGPHPLMVYAVYLTNILRPKLKYVGVIGSFGWGGKMYEQIEGMLSNLQVDFMEPIIIKGFPKNNDLKKIEVLAEQLAENHSFKVLNR